MFGNHWIWVALLAILLGLLSGQEGLLSIAALLCTIVPISRLWNRWALRYLDYRRSFDESRVFAGETVGLTLELANNKPLPLLWIRVDDRFPEAMAPAGRELLPSGMPRIGLLGHVAALLWNEKVRWRYEMPCRQRGFYFFGPAQVRSGDGFGIFESDRVLGDRTRLIVYPEVQPLERLGLPAKDPFGERRARLPVFEDPTRVVGTREYHPDDPMRRVHWKATARTQEMQVRVWEPTEARQLFVLLNVATFERHWQGVNPDLLERLISVVASICLHAYQDKHPVGLLANASVPQSDQPVKVAPGRSPQQMRYILEALAAITSFATTPIERLLREESPQIGWGATIVIVTAVVNEGLQSEIVRLRRAGRRLALISLDNDFSEEAASALTVQGITVHHLPHQYRTDRRDPAGSRTGDEPGGSQPVVEHPASSESQRRPWRPFSSNWENGRGMEQDQDDRQG